MWECVGPRAQSLEKANGVYFMCDDVTGMCGYLAGMVTHIFCLLVDLYEPVYAQHECVMI